MDCLTLGLPQTLCSVAFAKTNPVERPPLALLNADINRGSGTTHEDIGAGGAMRVRDYFEAQQPSSNAGVIPAAGGVLYDAPCRLIPINNLCSAPHQIRKPPRGAVSPKSGRCFDQAGSAAAFFHFLRQASRPKAPRAVARSGSAAGRGVADMASVFLAIIGP